MSTSHQTEHFWSDFYIKTDLKIYNSHQGVRSSQVNVEETVFAFLKMNNVLNNNMMAVGLFHGECPESGGQRLVFYVFVNFRILY